MHKHTTSQDVALQQISDNHRHTSNARRERATWRTCRDLQSYQWSTSSKSDESRSGTDSSGKDWTCNGMVNGIWARHFFIGRPILKWPGVCASITIICVFTPTHKERQDYWKAKQTQYRSTNNTTADQIKHNTHNTLVNAINAGYTNTAHVDKS